MLMLLCSRAPEHATEGCPCYFAESPRLSSSVSPENKFKKKCKLKGMDNNSAICLQVWARRRFGNIFILLGNRVRYSQPQDPYLELP